MAEWSDNAGKGATRGAQLGSAFGPWGTAIGAAGGALTGALNTSDNKYLKAWGWASDPLNLFGTRQKSAAELRREAEEKAAKRADFDVPGFEYQGNQYTDLAGGYGGRAAPTMDESAFRGDQTALVRLLQDQAAGRGVGQRLVRMQAQDAADRGMKQQLSMQAGAAPGSGAMAARSAALAGGQIQGQVGQQAAMGGLAAQLGATGQLGGVLQGARGQDLQRGQANLSAQIAQTGMNDQAQLEALRQRLQLAGMQQQGGISYQNNMSGLETAMIGQPTQQDRMMGMMGAGLQAYGAMNAGGQGNNGGSGAYSGPVQPGAYSGYAQSA